MFIAFNSFDDKVNGTYNLLKPVHLIIDKFMGSLVKYKLPFTTRSNAYDIGPEIIGQLNGKVTNATPCSRHQHTLARFDFNFLYRL